MDLKSLERSVPMLYGGHVRTVHDIQWLKAQGLDFGEVVLNDGGSRSYWNSPGGVGASKDGFFLIAHGPHEGDPNNLDNLCNKYMPALRETILTVRKMGINFLTTHLWMDSRFVFPGIITAKIEALFKIWEFGRNEGVTVSLENLSESSLDLGRILTAIPGLSLTLDVGHGQLLTQKNRSFEIIHDFSQSVRHVHIHDNKGGDGVKDDLHLPVGKGIIDFEGILYVLIKSGYNGTITLELKPEELSASLERTKAIVNHIINDL